jgi:hypothetical protein
MNAVANIVEAVPGVRRLGVFHWEATWTAVPGNGWDPAAPFSGNGWENQALFGYDDKALPATARFSHRRPSGRLRHGPGRTPGRASAGGADPGARRGPSGTGQGAAGLSPGGPPYGTVGAQHCAHPTMKGNGGLRC